MNVLQKLPIDLVRKVVDMVPRNYVVEYDTDRIEYSSYSLYFTDFIQEISKEITGGSNIDEIFDKVKKFIDSYIINVDWFQPKYMLEDDNDDRYEALYNMLENTFDDMDGNIEGIYQEFKWDEINPWFSELEEEDLPHIIYDCFFYLNDDQRVVMLKFCLYSLVTVIERYD